jgi:hypothetical protein
MRAPPPVEFSTSRATGWRVLQAALAAVAAASLAHWLLGPSALPAAVALDAAAALVAAALAYRLWPQPPVTLRWTGQRWQSASAPGEAVELRAPEVMIDLGRWMLLRCRTLDGGSTRWMALGAGAERLRWASFRAAVYSPASRSSGSSPTEPPRS